jgi:hypothetical protein
MINNDSAPGIRPTEYDLRMLKRLLNELAERDIAREERARRASGLRERAGIGSN